MAVKIVNDVWTKEQIKKFDKEDLGDKAAMALERTTHRFTIRAEPEVIELIREKAAKAGMPYQTLINSVLKRYATGRIKLLDQV